MRTLSHIWGPHREFSGPTSLAKTVLPAFLVKIRTFSHIWGPHREFSDPTSLPITVLPDLFR